jgi:hypothetical protein
MNDEIIDASDGDVGGDACDGIGSGYDIRLELDIVYM